MRSMPKRLIAEQFAGMGGEVPSTKYGDKAANDIDLADYPALAGAQG
jgi:hypothetical protein